MKEKTNSKRFFTPVLILVMISIVSISAINSYVNIRILKKHVQKDIEKHKKEYIQKNKEKVHQYVHFVNNSIKFKLAKMEGILKKTLRERIKISLNLAKHIYEKQKGKIPNQQIKKMVAEQLSTIRFNKNRGYYFIYDFNTNINYTHQLKKYIGKDMGSLEDFKGRKIVKLYNQVIKRQKIGFTKIYFYKDGDKSQAYSKLNCVTKFEPLNLVIGMGEYLDLAEKEIQAFVIKRFNDIKIYKNNYLFFLKLHNLNGGDGFATFIMNPNRRDLVGIEIDENYQGAKGQGFAKKMLVDFRAKGYSYTTYWYKKPNTKKPKLKMSYFYHQKDWDWIIGSGFYFDAFKQEVKNIEKSTNEYIREIIIESMLWIFLLSLITLIIAGFISVRINRTIKKYTDKLIDKKLELETAQEVAEMGSWNFDLATKELNWSKQTYKIFERDIDNFALNYDSFLTLLHPEDIDMVESAYAHSLQNKTAYNIKHRIIMDDGRVKWVRETCKTIFDKNGSPIFSNGTMQDITDGYTKSLKLQEKEKLLERQSKLSDMVELISAVGIHQEYDNLKVALERITEISSQTLNISRVGVWLYNEDKISMNCINLYSLDDKEHSSGVQLEEQNCPKFFDTLIKAKTMIIDDVSKNIISKDFEKEYLKNLNIKSMMDIPIKKEGKVIGFVSNSQIDTIKHWTKDEINFSKAIANSVSLILEIEQRKKIDLLLIEKTNEQNILLSLFDVGDTVLFNWNNDSKWSVKSVSQNVINLLGYNMEEFLSGKISYSTCIYQDDLEKVSKEVIKATQSDVKFFKHTPYRVVTKNNETRWVLDYTTLVKNSKNKITNYIGIITDITEQRRKDQHLIHQSRLAQMGEMMSMIAHQWRQPLNAISATSANLLIQAHLGTLSHETVITESTNIDNYSQHLSTTINDFRDFFKSNKKKQEVNFCELIESVLGIIETSILNKNIKLLKDFKCKEKFETYPNELKQVILNLVKNAEDVLLEKKVSNPFIKISTCKKGSKYILNVADNGGGIPKDIFDNIFNPYFSTKMKKDGTGLGLYMSKTIIEDHCNGTLTVANSQDGAVFTIEL